jgi:hypothetical protein
MLWSDCISIELFECSMNLVEIRSILPFPDKYFGDGVLLWWRLNWPGNYSCYMILLLLYSIHHFINCKSRLEWGVFGSVHALVIAFLILVYSYSLFNFNLLCLPSISLFLCGLLHFHAF